jgi:hypothetical protein
MPLQGHWERQQTPLGSRERKTVAIVAGMLVLAAAIVLFFSVVKDGRTAPGCVSVTVPSTMGAGHMHACGDAARQLCAAQQGRSAKDPSVGAAQKSCREAGFPVPATT